MAEPTGLNLSSILEAAGNFTAAVKSGSADIQTQYKKAADVSNANADLYSTLAENSILIDSIKQNAELATQNAKIKGANNLGTNLKAQGEVLTELSNVIASEYRKKDEALQVIQEKQSVGMFDDPLSWLINQFTINDDIAKHNAANARLQSAETQMQTLNQLTQSTSLTQSQLTESINSASIAATAKNIATKGAIEANKEIAQGYIYNVEGIKAALNGDKDLLQTAFSVYGAQKQEQNINIALAHLDLDRQRFDWQKQEKAAADAAKQQGKDVDQYFIDNINAGMVQAQGAGAQLLVPGSVRAGSILAALKSNAPIGKEFQEYYKIGERFNTLGIKQLATSPAHAVDILNTLPVKLPSAADAVKKVLDQATQEVAAAGKAGTIDLKNKSTVESAINQRVTELIAAQAKNIKPGDQDNVFNIPALKSLISDSPTLQKLPVVQKVIAPMIVSGADLSDQNKVFAAVATALQNKTITYPEALELTTVYHVGVSTNLEARQLTNLGITPKFSYNTSITTSNSAFGGSQIIDLTKPEQVSRALNKYLVAKISYAGLGSN